MRFAQKLRFTIHTHPQISTTSSCIYRICHAGFIMRAMPQQTLDLVSHWLGQSPAGGHRGTAFFGQSWHSFRNVDTIPLFAFGHAADRIKFFAPLFKAVMFCIQFL
jgi:hypothetical protein